MGEIIYQVKTHGFEGPLDLLLDLIEKRKLHINDISLAAVTDDYISFLEREEGVAISDRANFVLVASTLLLIKSKSLLPTLSLSDEETESIEDLERRLKILEKMRYFSRELSKIWGKEVLYGNEPSPELMEPIFSPPASLSLAVIENALRTVLQNLPKKEFVPEAVVQKVMSLEDMILRLTERVKTALSLSFKEFSGMGTQNKVEVIVGFLALLELTKRGIIRVTQDSLFEDIKVESDALSTPSYRQN